MRKLGIVLGIVAAMALWLVGFAAPASAGGHEETLCPNVTGNPVAQNFDQDPSGGGGEPLASTVEGLEETCRQSNTTDGLQPSPLLCGIAKGLDARPGENLGSSTVGALNDGLATEFPHEDLPIGFHECGATDEVVETDSTDDPPASGGADDPVVQPAVQQASAEADGATPRTGGELFAGAGFALASLGALLRRFLP